MTEANQIEALRERHADLDRQVQDEQARPMPDASTLATIKRQKLAIKDLIAEAEAEAAD